MRLSTKINNYLCGTIILLAIFSFFIDKDEEGIQAAVGFSLLLAVMIFTTSLLARRSLAVEIEDDDKHTARLLMRAGTTIAVILLVISVIGSALGISTGTISYLYILMIPAMGFYCYCSWGLRPPKEEKKIEF